MKELRQDPTASQPDNKTLRHCPCCMATVEQWCPVVYGPVDRHVIAQARRGVVALGGLNHGRNEPRWQCRRCNLRFGRPREEFDRFGRVCEVSEVTMHVANVPAWRLMKTMRLPAVKIRDAA